MKIDLVTLFPEMFDSYLSASILSRAQDADLLQIRRHNIRDYTVDKHHITDRPPFGGGGGMVLKPEPVFAAVEAIDMVDEASVILLSPQGRRLNQQIAEELAAQPHLVLICGRYEGVDERIRQALISDEISIGDYVLTGGELAAMVLIDAVARLLPGALGAEGAAQSDSHATGLLEGPHYTRPVNYRGMVVPDVLRSGHAARIEQWRREQALRRTWQRRPELLLTANLSEEERQFLATLALEQVDAESSDRASS